MSLDISLHDPTATYTKGIVSMNITHNLSKMAKEASIYVVLWGGDGMKAKDTLGILSNGILRMQNDPERFMKFNAPNGWGTYYQFIPWLHEWLENIKTYPEAIISVSS